MKTLFSFQRPMLRSPEDGGAAGASSGPSGGGSPASGSPSAPAAPSPSAPSTPSPDSGAPSGDGLGSEGFDFSSIFDAPLDTGVVDSAIPTDVPAQPPGVPQVPPATAQPQQPTGQPTAVQPGVPTPTDTSAAASRPHLDPGDPITLARALVEHEAAAIEHTAQSLFTLSNEEVEALETDVVGTIPKLLAKVAVKVQQQQLAQLSRIVPMMIERHARVTQRHTANEDKFYQAWPGLDRSKHGDVVRKYGAVYRAMNPQATLDKMIADLGPMVMMAAGVQPGQSVQPSRQGNGAVPPRPLHQPSAFVPAAGGTSGMSGSTQQGVFDFLGQSE